MNEGTEVAGVIMPDADDEIAALTGDLADEQIELAAVKTGSITVGSG